MGEMGLLGPSVKGPGCLGLSGVGEGVGVGVAVGVGVYVGPPPGVGTGVLVIR